MIPKFCSSNGANKVGAGGTASWVQNTTANSDQLREALGGELQSRFDFFEILRGELAQNHFRLRSLGSLIRDTDLDSSNLVCLESLKN